jgi:uncharacterized protein YbbC (DUF1343 family)
VLHAASVTGALRPTSEVLADCDLFRLAALFGPQHGIAATTQDNMIEWEGSPHPRLGLPIFSLYGKHREPTGAMLESLDCLLVDLCDVGARYYTFIWTLFLSMRACERAGIPIVVCDRPNPINGVTTEGEVLDPEYRSFVGLHPISIRHGRTIGELAGQFRDESFPRCDLHVLPMEGWERPMWHDDTGLPWVMPSPNMPTLDTATVYPGMCLLEGTNLSEGRGTTRPFEIFGAPWIDGPAFVERLRCLGLPGVRFREAAFEPTFQKHAGEVCRGAQIHVTDRRSYLPVRTGMEIIRVARQMYPDHFAWKQPPYEYEYDRLPIEILLGGPVEESFPSFG